MSGFAIPTRGLNSLRLLTTFGLQIHHNTMYVHVLPILNFWSKGCKCKGHLDAFIPRHHGEESAATSLGAAHLSGVKANHLTGTHYCLPTNMALYRAGYATCNYLTLMRLFQDIKGYPKTVTVMRWSCLGPANWKRWYLSVSHRTKPTFPTHMSMPFINYCY